MRKPQGQTGQSRQPATIDQQPQGSLLESPAAAPAAQPVARREPAKSQAVAVPTTKSPTDILMDAIQRPGMDIAMLEKLMDLQKRWADEEARKAFVRAMVAFKSDLPKIRKNRTANVVPKNGGTAYSYEYADLPSVLESAVPALSRCGITHEWDMNIDHANQRIEVTCKLTHFDGHSVKVTGGGPFDTTGGKNPTQTISSANSYWQRYTFLAATGLSTASAEDDDGQGTEGNPGLAPISEEQVKTIRDLITEVDADEGKLLEYVNSPTVEEIPVQAYDLAVHLLNSRKRLRS